MSKYDPEKHGAKCSLCPRRTQTPVPPEGPKGARIAWVGQDPGRQEVKQGRPFIGPTGKKLDKMWSHACSQWNLPVLRSEVWITNAALCAPVVGSEKEARAAVDCCRPRLLAELKQLAPDAGLLLMGKNAYYALSGNDEGVGALQGFHIPVDLKKMAQVSTENQPEPDEEEPAPF